MKRFILSLTIVVCLLVLLPAQSPVSAKDTWMSVRSRNFLLVGNASEKEIRQVGVRLEQFRDVFSRLFPKAVINTPVPTTVVVFKNDSSYKPFKPNATTAGYFQSGQNVNYITLTSARSGEEDSFRVIFHEYTHLMVNNTLGNVPTWFNEGLAEYYSSFFMEDDQKFVLGRPIANHIYLLRDKKMLPLRTLFKVDQKSAYYNERDKQSVFYAESWALVHYLILGKRGQRRDQMSKFVELTANKVPMEEAFQQAFATPFEAMEKELREYIGNSRYPILPGHFEKKLDTETTMQSAPITEAEAQAYLGDLALHSNLASAEGYLQKALTLDPNLGMAHASLGLLRVREGKPEEARKSLERAVAANYQNYLVHYYYAYALSREGQDSMGVVYGFKPENAVKMREELKKAIQLRPDFPESYSLLAFVNLVTRTQLDESIEMLKRALAMSPGRNDFVFMMAQVYMGKEDYKSARELLQNLSENNNDAELRERAKSLLAQIASMDEQLARYREAQRQQPDAPNKPALRPPGDAGTPEVIGNVDPSSYLRDALKKPQAGETRVQGTLLRIDCNLKSLTFVIKVSDVLVRVKSTSFEQVDITSFSPDAGNQITCGPRKLESNVVVVYAVSTDIRADGVAKSIEFVPKDFVLDP